MDTPSPCRGGMSGASPPPCPFPHPNPVLAPPEIPTEHFQLRFPGYSLLPGGGEPREKPLLWRVLALPRGGGDGDAAAQGHPQGQGCCRGFLGAARCCTAPLGEVFPPYILL